MRRSRVALVAGISTIAIGATCGVISGISERRSRALLEEAKQEMSAGRYALARSRLTELVARRPSWAEALYHLGICEQARKRPDAALETFERVPPDSEWTGWSLVRRS